MILSTPAEIAEGLKMFLAEHECVNPELSFDNDKMTVAEASSYRGICYATMCKWINSGKIKVYGKGRTRFILKSELIKSLTK